MLSKSMSLTIDQTVGNPRGVVVNMFEYDIVARELKLSRTILFNIELIL